MFQELFDAYRSPRKIAYLVALAVLMVLLPFGAWSLWQTRQAEAGWFNANWAYRAPVTVANPGSASLSNFQVDFTLDTAALIAAGKMQADCADLRVTLASGDILPHWIETGDNGCGQSATRIWTRVTNIPASGTTIYAYYGNSTTTDSQDGEAVFEFFDDFSGESLDGDKWNITNPAHGTITTTDSELTINNTSGSSTIAYGITSNFTLDAGHHMVSSRSKGTAGRHLSLIKIGENPHPFPHGTGGTGASLYYRADALTGACSIRNGANSDSTTISANYSSYSVFSLEFVPNNLVNIFHNSASICDFSGSVVPSTGQFVAFGTDGHTKPVTLIVDWVLVRKYAADSPTSTTTSEQSRPADSVALGPISEFSPTQIEGLQLWLDAADQSTLFQDSAGTTPVMANADPVGRWEDKSGNGNHATQETPEVRATTTFEALNQQNTISFDGTQHLETSLYHESNWQAFVVYKTNTLLSNSGAPFGAHDNQNRRFYIDIGASQNLRFGYGNLAPAPIAANNLFALTSLTTSEGAVYLHRNGQSIYSANFSFGEGASADPILIGSRTYIGEPVTKLNGDIAEILIFNSALTTTQRQQVEGYLAHKWGLVAELPIGHPFRQIPPAPGGVTIQEGVTTLPDPIAHWKFDEGRGTTAHDSSGSNLDMTLYGASSWTQQGKFGGALNLNGVDQYARRNTDIPPDHTVSMWIKPSDLTSTRTIFSFLNLAYTIRTDSTKKISFTTSLDGYQYCTGDKLIDTDRYYHIAVTYKSDGTVKRIYVDGELDKECIQGNFVAGMLNRTTTIGGVNTDFSYAGLIDEVKIYDTALSPAQVKLDMNQGAQFVMGATGTNADGSPSQSADRRYCVPGDPSPCAPPVGEWLFEENTGTTAHDTSGNANHGTLTNMDQSNWVLGANNQGAGLGFPASNQYVVAGTNIQQLGIERSGTISTWLRISEHKLYNDLISDYASSNGTTLRVNLDGSVEFYLYPGNYRATSNAGVISENKWHHFSVVLDFNEIRLFVDGNMVATTSLGGAVTSSTTLKFGRRGDGVVNQDFNGQLDQVRIYDYARSPAQIAWDYNQGAPVGHWKFDECTGATANDSSGNNNHGTISIGASGTQSQVGTCTSAGTAWGNGASGKHNASLNFDGQDDWISIPHSASLVPSLTSVSVAAWIYPTKAIDAGSYTTILQKGYDGGTIQYALSYDHMALDGPKFTIRSSSNWYELDTPGYNPPLNAWTHLVGTWDGTTMRFYADGQEISNRSAVATMQNASAAIGIGDDEGRTSPFQGRIDDARVYSYALTPAQILNLYNDGAVKFGN